MLFTKQTAEAFGASRRAYQQVEPGRDMQGDKL